MTQRTDGARVSVRIYQKEFLSLMSLRFKVGLFVSALFVLLGSALYVLFNRTVMQGFLELEQESALHHAARAQFEIQSLANETALLASRLATNDEGYAAVQAETQASAVPDFSADALGQLQVRHLLVQDLEGKPVFARSVDTSSRIGTDLAPESSERFAEVSKLALVRRTQLGGLYSVNGITYLVGTAPITNSSGKAPFKGTLLVAQQFDEPALTRLRALLRGSLRIEPIERLQAERDFGPEFQKVLAEKRSQAFGTPLRMYGIDTVKDVLGTPILGLVAGQTRELHARGAQARNLVLLCVIAFTIVGIFLAILLINKGVVEPLRRIGEQAKRIGEQQSDEMRLDLQGDREISELGAEINRMLEQLSLSKSDEVSARRTAESANSVKAEVISKLSQELRTSLTSILGMHHMLLKKESSDANRSLVAQADRSAWELVSTINKILSFSRTESGRLDVVDAPEAEYDGIDDGSLFAFEQKLRILIADDTPTNRIVLEEMLAEAGHTVVSVDDGKDLLERLTPFLSGVPNSEQFDLVLTDISMPVMDGYEATRAIRELEAKFGRKLSVPIIAVTAHAMTEEQQKMREAGVDGVITKPIRPVDVSAEFKRLLPNLR